MKWLLKLAEWITGRTEPVPGPYAPRVKFPAGMRLTCSECNSLIATAKHDIRTGDAVSPAAWEIADREAFFTWRHCKQPAVRLNGFVTELHTPKGWRG